MRRKKPSVQFWLTCARDAGSDTWRYSVDLFFGQRSRSARSSWRSRVGSTITSISVSTLYSKVARGPTERDHYCEIPCVKQRKERTDCLWAPAGPRRASGASGTLSSSGADTSGLQGEVVVIVSLIERFTDQDQACGPQDLLVHFPSQRNRRAPGQSVGPRERFLRRYKQKLAGRI